MHFVLSLILSLLKRFCNVEIPGTEANEEGEEVGRRRQGWTPFYRLFFTERRFVSHFFAVTQSLKRLNNFRKMSP